MKAELTGNNVRANCPDCDGVITTFESTRSGSSFGSIIIEGKLSFNGIEHTRVLYILLRCANCGRGGLAKVHDSGNTSHNGHLEWFLPNSVDKANIPNNVPEDIKSEFTEAEECASIGAYRAATALLRSCLEKTFKVNGYTSGNLAQKINKVCDDGIITSARKNKAHEEIRVLGNNILHDEWRIVDYDEYDLSHHYTQRILEDFYDDRVEVESILREKGVY
ncbi:MULTISPECIES: DUF4145 domain-containing protein [Dehalobacter]|jgi:hypothetical protein|uniref:DUF4145 domain-containing protein n=2 Tax=Dehalobacter restrictus TaxID=55583 RepID=A0A857DGU6_9FIRM|nr:MULTISPECIES: DUF4145 domain-containing protein [Dehalobacter]AHF08983.1 hypothetical protein DEHRE_01655 [Dehalobacter restrictus DSM 9455]MDJ0306102.1 DUF4145 domain-containing protein [Dehalobacter sp.]OCZ51938.1 hypothetical protein A7D23_12265 [Dehalobacter sp. TeCB1]QGZ99504.1 DUF4145 domain-containing protein [Dehalobacter restrictus]